MTTATIPIKTTATVIQKPDRLYNNSPMAQFLNQKKKSKLDVPSVGLTGLLTTAKLVQNDPQFNALREKGIVRWGTDSKGREGWQMFTARKLAPTINPNKTQAVLSKTGAPGSLGNQLPGILTTLNNKAMGNGFLQMGATQLRKNFPAFIGRWTDSRGIVRQLPKAKRQYFNLSTKQGIINYDLWQMSNAWNKFAGYWSQYQNDLSKTQTTLQNKFVKQTQDASFAQQAMRKMLHYLRYQQHQLNRPEYGTTITAATLPKLRAAAIAGNWPTFYAQYLALGKRLKAQATIRPRDILKRQAKGTSIIQTSAIMTNVLINKQKQAVSTLIQKQAIQNKYNTYIRQVPTVRAANYPILHSSQRKIRKQLLRKAWQATQNGARDISLSQFYKGQAGSSRYANWNIVDESTGAQIPAAQIFQQQPQQQIQMQMMGQPQIQQFIPEGGQGAMQDAVNPPYQILLGPLKKQFKTNGWNQDMVNKLRTQLTAVMVGENYKPLAHQFDQMVKQIAQQQTLNGMVARMRLNNKLMGYWGLGSKSQIFQNQQIKKYLKYLLSKGDFSPL